MVAGGSASFPGLGFGKAPKPPQYPNGMFAMVPADGTKLIEDRGFLLSRGMLILQEDRLHIVSF